MKHSIIPKLMFTLQIEDKESVNRQDGLELTDEHKVEAELRRLMQNEKTGRFDCSKQGSHGFWKALESYGN